MLPHFGIFEQRCYNHPCAGFYVDRRFPHLWVNTKECDFRIMSKDNASFCKKPPHHLPRRCTTLLPAYGAFLGHNLLKLFTLRLSWWLLPLMLQPVWQEFKSVWTLRPCASRNQGAGAAGDAGTSFRTRRQSAALGVGQAGCQDPRSIPRPSQKSQVWGSNPWKPGDAVSRAWSRVKSLPADPSTYDPSVTSRFG